jgi:hypothetical protein
MPHLQHPQTSALSAGPGYACAVPRCVVPCVSEAMKSGLQVIVGLHLLLVARRPTMRAPRLCLRGFHFIACLQLPSLQWPLAWSNWQACTELEVPYAQDPGFAEREWGAGISPTASALPFLAQAASSRGALCKAKQHAAHRELPQRPEPPAGEFGQRLFAP